MKKIVGILTLSVISIVMGCNASALSYSDNVGVNFTFSPSLSVSLSSASGGSNADLVINDLTPGTSSDSNVIDVNVLSNNANGYVLNSSVGNNSTYSTALDNLVHSDITISSTSPKFTNLATNADLASMDDSADDNVWGYSYLDTTLTGSTWSNYNGLPLYSDTEHTTTLKTSTNPSLSTGDIIKFKIAAKASTTQASGEYNNVINFTVVGNTNPVSFYDAFSAAGKSMYNGYYKMQDMTPAICNNIDDDADNPQSATLIDIRDNKTYTVAKLANNCWMTQNLAIEPGAPMTTDDTNITSEQYLENKDYYALPGEGYDLKTDGPKADSTSTGYCNNNRTPSGGLFHACAHTADSVDVATLDNLYSAEELGVWYNYAAATANTVYGQSMDDANFDICPSNWRLPNNTNNDAPDSEIRNLTTILNNNAVLLDAFRPLYEARYLSGIFYYDSVHRGAWWSASSYDENGAFVFSFSENKKFDVLGHIANFGIYVRCIANSQ